MNAIRTATPAQAAALDSALFYMRKARLEGLKQYEEDTSPIVAMS